MNASLRGVTAGDPTAFRTKNYKESVVIHSRDLHGTGQFCILQWRHNGLDSVSNHQPHDCLLNHLFRRRSKKTSKLRVTGLCEGNSPGTGEFPAQTASNAENVSIWWRHHERARKGHDEVMTFKYFLYDWPFVQRIQLWFLFTKIQWYGALVFSCCKTEQSCWTTVEFTSDFWCHDSQATSLWWEWLPVCLILMELMWTLQGWDKMAAIFQMTFWNDSFLINSLRPRQNGRHFADDNF